jgi:gluconolactonase
VFPLGITLSIKVSFSTPKNKSMKYWILIAFLGLFACSTQHIPSQPVTILDRSDAALDAIVAPNATQQIISRGFDWSEGPLWLPTEKKLIFSDVPLNTVFQWSPKKGTSVYLKPSGYTGTIPRGGEPGSNGLLLDPQGRLVLCQHGDRQLARMNAPLSAPAAIFEPIGGKYQGKRFNSPNDAIYDRQGNVYLTDPPYGLVKQENDPGKELPYQGVYQIDPSGKVTLLIDSITRPNGIALSPDQRYLYIANSDPNRAIWYRYELGDHSVRSGGVFFDDTPRVAKFQAVPDGMKVDGKGNLIASGPGGVVIISPQGKLLGRIRLSGNCSNTALADDDKTLYVTNDSLVVRIRLRR